MPSKLLPTKLYSAGIQVSASLAGDISLLAAEQLQCIFPSSDTAAAAAAAALPTDHPPSTAASHTEVAVPAAAYAQQNVSAASLLCSSPPGYLGGRFSIAVQGSPEVRIQPVMHIMQIALMLWACIYSADR